MDCQIAILSWYFQQFKSTEHFCARKIKQLLGCVARDCRIWK